MLNELGKCACSIVRLGAQEVGRNWNPDCWKHGTKSKWYHSDEQIAKRKAQSDRTRDLQAQAREARRNART